MNFKIPLILAIVCATNLPKPSLCAEPSPEPATAWKPGYPAAGLNDAARQLIADFKERAVSLKSAGGKLRVLIIGDSLSDGFFHWSHYFRAALQEAYGDGGIGNINAKFARNPLNAAKGWLLDPTTDFSAELTEPWRQSWASRGDVWPYLGWNSGTMASDSREAKMSLKVRAAEITAVYSTGMFTTFDGDPVENRAGGFTIKVDDDVRKIPPAVEGQPLDIGLEKFSVKQGMHTVKFEDIHSGWLWLHGLLLENEEPGVVVYNISNGAWWPANYLWRQPGFEKILKAMKPDYVIYFLSKPDSGSLDRSLSEEGGDTDYRRMVDRVSKALPDAKSLHFICWDSKSGSNFPKDIDARKERRATLEETHAAILNLYEGLDRVRMGELKWFKDEIHLDQPGGEGIGKGIADLFLPDKRQ